MKITDIHAHVTTDPAAQVARARKAGVDRTVLLSTRIHPEAATTLEGVRAEFARLTAVVSGAAASVDEVRRATAEVIAALEAHPEETVGFISAPLVLGDTELKEWFDGYLRRPDIVGIGELTPAPNQAAGLEPALAVSADHGGVPVLVHGFAPNTVDDLRTYAALAARHPNVPIIVGALGGLNAMELIDLAVDRPNLYIDLSSALQVFMVKAAAHAVPEQCLFGSNTPYGDVLAARATVEAAIHDPGVLRRVLGENFAQLISN
ncbi:amidohydrolase family protein [Nocardia sp. NBC_01327]|uniref:amidohydrolase family protein n=1 Tax=Nocardia sp. NBC_01327 TaxID=2903593 RepID=UPI002E11B667|nr:amidohydrolase family protein [Nocardia sp. NBC_01327]